MNTFTTIAGRTEFLTRLDSEILEHETAGAALAVILLNIKDFRSINFLYGFTVADRILQNITERLGSIKRSEDIAGHVSVDEFALVLPNLKSPYFAELAANKLISTLEEITLDDGRSVDIRAHIGIALYPENGDSGEALLQKADTAMHSARDAAQPYKMAEEKQSEAITPGVLVSELGRAIKNDEFEIYYQPKVDLRSQRMLGAEALIRWNNPRLGFVGPDEFISLAEKNGLIFPMTLWCFNSALRQSAEIRRLWPDYRVAVNLSAVTLTEIELVDLVKRSLRTWDTPPDKLMIEVTESAIMQDPDTSIETLHGLRNLGVKLSIDDFGTGYSSFSYLKELPVHELKIDQSFVREIMSDIKDSRIVQSMINLAENFKLSVIAEGIEDEQTMQTLINMGCHHGQGYYFAKPMKYHEFLDWIVNSKWAGQALAADAN